MSNILHPPNQNPQNSQSFQNTKYFVTLGILLFLIVIFGAMDIVIFTTKNNNSNNGSNVSNNQTVANNTTTNNTDTNSAPTDNTETLARKTCTDLNGEFDINGPQYSLNATEYYSCKTNDKGKIFDIYVFEDSFMKSILGAMTLYSMQSIGVGNSSDGMFVLEVGEDYYKGYETYSNSYLFFAGFNNLAIEIFTDDIEQTNNLLHDFGYPK